MVRKKMPDGAGIIAKVQGIPRSQEFSQRATSTALNMKANRVQRALKRKVGLPF